MDLVNLAWLLLLSAIWGASYMLIKVGVAEMPPLTFAMMRVFFGTLVLAVMVRAQRLAIPRSRGDWQRYLFMGMFNTFLPFAAISWGTQHIPSGIASILNATMPLFVFTLAIALHLERPSLWRLLGLLLGFAGIVVLTLPRLEGGLNVGLLGSLAIVASAICYAVATVFARRHMSGYAPLVSSLGQVGTGWVFLLVTSLAIEGPLTPPVSLRSLGVAAFLGAVSTALAYLIYYRLVRNIGATRTSMNSFVIPLFGVFWGWLILDERLGWHAFLALGLIVVGLVLVNDLLGLERRPA